MCGSSVAPGWEARTGQGSFGTGWELLSPREASSGSVAVQQKWHRCSFFSFSRVRLMEMKASLVTEGSAALQF